MKYALFSNEHEVIILSELIKKIAKTCLIHITSSKRMIKLFSANSVMFSKVIKKNRSIIIIVRWH